MKKFNYSRFYNYLLNKKLDEDLIYDIINIINEYYEKDYENVKSSLILNNFNNKYYDYNLYKFIWKLIGNLKIEYNDFS